MMADKNSNISKIMQEAVDLSYKTFGNILKQVWLFGSYARNDVTEDSDIDFCVVLSEPVETWKYINSVYSDFTMDILKRYDELPSVFITDHVKFTDSKIPVYETIKSEGILYYGI